MIGIISSARRAPPSCPLAPRTAHSGRCFLFAPGDRSGRILGHAPSPGKQASGPSSGPSPPKNYSPVRILGHALSAAASVVSPTWLAKSSRSFCSLSRSDEAGILGICRRVATTAAGKRGRDIGEPCRRHGTSNSFASGDKLSSRERESARGCGSRPPRIDRRRRPCRLPSAVRSARWSLVRRRQTAQP